MSHHGEDGSPSEAVWYDDVLDGDVPVHSDAVTKSSSDLLLSDLLLSSVECFELLSFDENSYRPRQNLKKMFDTLMILNKS